MSRSVSDWAREKTRPVLLPLARLLSRAGLSPNGVTILGLLSFGAAGAAVGAGHPRAGGVILALLGPLDALDGLMARDRGEATRFGAFLDSTVDRYGEVLLFLGILVHLGGGVREAVLVLVALTGSLLVSYTRARAEALGFECKVGLLTRFERLFLLAVGLLFGLLYPVLLLLALFTHATALQRILHVRRKAREAGD